MVIRNILILSLLLAVACGDDTTGPTDTDTNGDDTTEVIDTTFHLDYFPLGDSLQWIYEHTELAYIPGGSDTLVYIDTVAFTLTKTTDYFDNKVLYDYAQTDFARFTLFVEHDTVFSLEYVEGSDPVPRLFWKPCFSVGDEWTMFGMSSFWGGTTEVQNTVVDLSAELEVDGTKHGQCLKIRSQWGATIMTRDYDAYFANRIGLVYAAGTYHSWPFNGVFEYKLLWLTGL